MHHPTQLAGRRGCIMLTVALAIQASGCSKSAPSAPPAPVAPELTRISPDSGIRGTTILVTLTGANFVAGTTQVATSGDIAATGIVSETATSISANLAISPTAPLGDAQVWATTGSLASGVQRFTVLAAQPTLASVTPNFGGQGTTVSVTLTGANFITGATAVGVNGLGVTTNDVVVTSSSSLTVNFVIAADAALGAERVTVTTAGGTSASQPFTVNAASPVTVVMPKPLQQ